MEGPEPGHQPEEQEEQEAQEQQTIAAPPPPTPTQQPRTSGSGSKRRHRSRSPNSVINDKLLETVTAPQVENSAAQNFMLSLVPQMERLSSRNQTVAKIRFLQILDKLETAEQERPVSFAVPPQQYDRRSEARHRPTVLAHQHGSMAGPSSLEVQDPYYED